MPPATHHLLRESEIAIQAEASYGVSPGAIAGADFIKHKSSIHFSRKVERYDRDNDRDFQQASVNSTQKGRSRASFAWDADVIPSGVTATPTPPDIHEFIRANLGNFHTATAHTTTAAGSVGTAINFAVGGVAASGVAVNDIIMIDVDAANGYEARRITALPGGDAVTVDRAFTVDPAAGRNVKVGTTYRPDVTQLRTVHLWMFNQGLKYKLPGCILPDSEWSVNMSEKAPVAQVKFTGEGMPKVAHAEARPTPVTAGIPLVPTVGKVWLGATRYLEFLVQAMLKFNNGLELRDSEADFLYPSGAKRTGNKSRYKAELTLEGMLTDQTQTLLDGADTLTSYDVLLQWNNVVGQTVVWNCPKWQPDVDEQEQDGELGIKMSGRCYAAANDGEVFIGYL